ncbi:MAG TPA: type II toxin-antitoxin system VapC family toxin [Polyangiaceae bacterium]|nr:type II toxin-antitoxin system VapC family toxin [Polyangiaceae bacterium]
MSRFHLDTDFLVYALSSRGVEWRRLAAIVDSDAMLEISALSWYEFCRGPRTPEQIAVARGLFGDQGIIALTEAIAERAGEEFRRLGSPRRRAADVVIGITAVSYGARLVTRNRTDFEDIHGLELEAVS